MRFLLDKPQQIAASSGLLVSAHPDNLSDTEIDVDAIQPAAQVDLRQLGDIFTPSSSPISKPLSSSEMGLLRKSQQAVMALR